MKKKLLSLLFIFLVNSAKAFYPARQTTMELTKLKASVFYLRSVKALRLGLIGALGASVCFMLFLGGFILFHVAMLCFAPWSDEVKMYISFFCATVYIVSSVSIFVYFLSQARWTKMFNANSLVKRFAEKPA